MTRMMIASTTRYGPKTTTSQVMASARKRSNEPCAFTAELKVRANDQEVGVGVGAS